MQEAMTDKELYDYLVAEYKQPFSGWDFSRLEGRREHMHGPDKPWDYTAAVLSAMPHAHAMLDMGTGGGERLAEFAAHQSRPPHICATEGYAPNFPIASKLLEPLGIAVYKVDDDPLPFGDNQFDLIINRHASYDPREVLRVLKADGRFITQQVGDQTNREIHNLLDEKQHNDSSHPDAKQKPIWKLSVAVHAMEEAGLRVHEQHEHFSVVRYHDIGALVYYLKGVVWEIPDFSVERYFHRLVEVYRLMQREGYVDVTFHEFFVVAGAL